MRVVLCDDHPVYRDGLRLLLGELGIEVVGEADTGEAAVSLVDDVVPDVVVMDLRLPGMSGVAATRHIAEQHPEVGVLVLTMLEDDATLFAALRAGAGGYLLKGAGRSEILRALDAVSRGDVMLARAVAPGLRAGLARSSPSSQGARAFPALGRRELEVLVLVARGRTNEQIAAALFVSVKTVRNNVSAILAKLGAGSRAEAVAIARDAGLGVSGPGVSGPGVSGPGVTGSGARA